MVNFENNKIQLSSMIVEKYLAYAAKFVQSTCNITKWTFRKSQRTFILQNLSHSLLPKKIKTK